MTDTTQAPPESTTVTITVNGKEIIVPKGRLVIDAAEEHGVFIPRFCYHPRMQPVGMCRMCIVDIDTGRGPALQPSCMIECTDGMKIETESDATKKAQDGVLEFLLINHPLDCPVCDKGGECPLQDNAYAYGPGESRFVEEKRHFEKPIPISDLVYLDRERCILCDRCTRFAKEVAGDALIHFINRGSQTEVNTFPDDPFSSYFSGNTVQICPVGALTAKAFRFKARPWDLEKAESTCTSCAVGCRVTIETSRNHVLRYQGVDIDPVNWGWLCDRGRFDFEAIESEDRLDEPMVRHGDELVKATWNEALTAAAEALRRGLDSEGAAAIGVVGGARLANEAAYAWAKLAKGVLGTDNVDCQLGDGLPADFVVSLPTATIDDVCASGGTVVVVAPDLKEELPVLFIRLRDAIVNRGVNVIEISPLPTSLTPLAAVTLRHRPGDAGTVAHELLTGGNGAVLEGDVERARELIAAGPVTAIIGRVSVAESPAPVVEAAATLLEAKPDTRFLVALRRANVRGAIDMGLAPGLLPGRVGLEAGRQWFAETWEWLPPEVGLDATGILTAAAEGKVEALVLLGADPIRDFPDRDLAQRALAGARTVIAVDAFLNDSVKQADVVLAAAGYAETRGTTTNVEGRVSLLTQKVTPPGTARKDWMIPEELAYRLDRSLGLESSDQIWEEIERVCPAHEGITLELLNSDVAEDGVVVPLDPKSLPGYETPVAINGTAEDSGPQSDPSEAPIPVPERDRPGLIAYTPPEAFDAPAPDGYSLRLVTTRKLYDLATSLQHSPSLAGLAPGTRFGVNQADLDRLGVEDGGRVKITSARGSMTVEAHVTPGVPQGVAHLLVNQPGPNPAELIDATQPVTDIRMETL